MPRILVIEDDADLVFGLRNNLEIEGYEVDLAGDGAGAAAAVARGWPSGVWRNTTAARRPKPRGGTRVTSPPRKPGRFTAEDSEDLAMPHPILISVLVTSLALTVPLRSEHGIRRPTLSGVVGSPQAFPGPPPDSAIFEAVVRAIKAATVGALEIDPRPLKADPEIVTTSSGALADIPPHQLEVRRRILHSLGIAEGDAFSRVRCDGVLAPEDPTTDRSGCPSTGSLRRVVLGLPRPGGAYLSQTDIDERQEGRERGYWAVRSIECTYTSASATVVVYDYVLEPMPHRKGWRIKKRESLLFID